MMQNLSSENQRTFCSRLAADVLREWHSKCRPVACNMIYLLSKLVCLGLHVWRAAAFVALQVVRNSIPCSG